VDILAARERSGGGKQASNGTAPARDQMGFLTPSISRRRDGLSCLCLGLVIASHHGRRCAFKDVLPFFQVIFSNIRFSGSGLCLPLLWMPPYKLPLILEGEKGLRVSSIPHNLARGKEKLPNFLYLHPPEIPGVLYMSCHSPLSIAAGYWPSSAVNLPSCLSIPAGQRVRFRASRGKGRET